MTTEWRQTCSSPVHREPLKARNEGVALTCRDVCGEVRSYVLEKDLLGFSACLWDDGPVRIRDLDSVSARCFHDLAAAPLERERVAGMVSTRLALDTLECGPGISVAFPVSSPWCPGPIGNHDLDRSHWVVGDRRDYSLYRLIILPQLRFHVVILWFSAPFLVFDQFFPFL